MRDQAATALVVDDDPSLRFLCRVNLELGGFSVCEASTLSEAREAIDDAAPDVALVDVNVGCEECRPLLERLRADGVPVALVTGSVEIDRWRGRADAVLAKPFAPQELVAVAQRLAGTIDA
jgi:DNA-binding response OmpR family regulator